ncbi:MULTISPECIES: hypothetical protein [Bacillus]|uniref:Uncharacterized protein n=1 Tax=Bacillus wiedmannii TaxID=1890302 RepID=A0AB37YQD8_9BACI|nr:hypothetical protein [Bacillus wiedmannii]EJS70707.1 hypothetical protein ICW_02176 [Bacillus wiedmannii]EJV62225.1 hypothetical protein IEO_02971 [Bacillus wiedmannii]OFD03491.1 hypothetical protein BTGOE6_28470 [Bacillus wiedmannii]SCC22084.1 Uncharacterized protein BC10311_02042 [Bacillus wiedmannii]
MKMISGYTKKIKGIVEEKIKAEEKSFPLSGVLLIDLSVVIFFLK